MFATVSPALAQAPSPQRLYEMGMNAFTGVGPERNNQNALDYTRRSAELGYPPAEVVMGYFYDTGTIVTRDPAEAANWYKKAALQDDPVGEWLLGRLIFMGAVPPRDLEEAARWLQKAAAHNDPFGEYLLGKVKLERQDYSAAAGWFRKAAMQGLPQAQQQLGMLLKQGQGVNMDKFEAYVWLQVSYDAGNQSAPVANALLELGAALGSNQIEQAKSKARDLEQTANRAVAARGCTGWAGEFGAIPAPPTPDIENYCR
ncbi:MAG TPA: tetratricopeptide repeat protein [Terriglobales bacterium]|nr:tetratricopeptide repeat protein [Terriglobales bacterium]